MDDKSKPDFDDKNNDHYEITVNGIQIKTGFEKLVAADVLKLAATHNAISGEPEKYVLASDDPPHEFKPEDWVDFLRYKEFTAERSGATPVA